MVVNKIDNRILEIERYTRGFNCRFYNFQEETILADRKKEDCRSKLSAKLESVGLTGIAIENAHRVGEFTPGGRPRAIIARFNNRPDRRLVLSKRKELFNANCPVYEDLCKQDLEKKSKHSRVMNALYEQGRRTWFTRGNWYVDGNLYNPAPQVPQQDFIVPPAALIPRGTGSR